MMLHDCRLLAALLWAVPAFWTDAVHGKKSVRNNNDDFASYPEGSLPYAKTAPRDCPPPNFESYSKPAQFNLSAYIQGRWFVQQQMPVRYLEADSNYCVTAQYQLFAERGGWKLPSALGGPRPGETTLNVYNYANVGKVNGQVRKATLMAIVAEPKENPSRVIVGFPFLPRLLWGPYWVVAAGPGPKEYSWALISGGAPSRFGRDWYCRTGTGTNDSGLWIFTREPVASNATIARIRSIAKGMGYDTSVLLPVEQEGCTYQDL